MSQNLQMMLKYCSNCKSVQCLRYGYCSQCGKDLRETQDRPDLKNLDRSTISSE